MAPSPHVFSLKNAKPFFESELGSIQRCTADQLPILNGMSLKRLVLEPKAIREPHWHANTPELTYCLRGKALVNLLNTTNSYASFVVGQGEMFSIPNGSLHHIENLSDTEQAEFLVCFRHEKPEDFALSSALGAMTPAVLGNTYNVDESAFSHIDLSTKEKNIVPREGAPTVPETAYLPSPYKFNVEGMEPPLAGEGVGSVKTARSQYWKTLEEGSLAMYSLTIEDTGMREPHWHPITAELGYVERGNARMTILDPDGSTDTYYLQPGDMYFVPPGYPHQIECLSKGDIHFCIFFNQAMPQDIGYKNSLTAMPHEAMAATLGISRADMPKLEGAATDPLMVPRRNPLDKSKL